VKRKLAIGVPLVVVVVGLVAVNLSLRPDPEPEYVPQDTADRRSERDASVEPAPWDRADESPVAIEEPASDEQPVAPGEEVDGCDHPLIPARAGQWRTFRWELSEPPQSVEVRIQAMRTRARPDGQREVVWAIRASSDEDERLEQVALRTRCVPDDEAESPWFGFLERSLNYRDTRRTAQWRWPVELAEGTAFRGTVTFDVSEAAARPPDDAEGDDDHLTVSRNYVVAGREEVEVPAGTFDAWRVVFEERQAFRGPRETGNGTLWVAPEVGLVKSRLENSRGQVQTTELTSRSRDEPE